MNYTPRLVPLILAAALALLGLRAHAQEAAPAADTGTVTGRVLNAENGMYLSKAVVRVAGTGISTLTDDSGYFTLRRVPAGEQTLIATFTGQDPATARIDVRAGSTIDQLVQFNRPSDTSEDDDTVVLNPYVVNENRYRNAAEIAIQEERYSVNIKSVVAADAFGDIPSGNVGEFIKYLPGVELEYGGTYIAPTDAYGVSVRGFGAADTAIYVDGAPVASASQASLTTQVGLDMLTINNASRVELTKVPTPDMPMNSIGGTINLITRSAFEQARPSFNWRAYLTVNSENPNPFERVPGPKSKKVMAGQPGFEISYVHPFSEKIGFSISASTFSQFSENRRFRPEWGVNNVNLDLRPFGGANNTPASNDVGPVSLANPFLTRISLTDAPRTSRTSSVNLRMDWRIFDGLTVSPSYGYSMYESADAARRIQIRIQRPQDWDATSVTSLPYLTSAESATGSAFNPGNSVDMNVDSRDKEGYSHSLGLRLTYKKGPWDVYALASNSWSRASFIDIGNGHFSTVDVSATVGQVIFNDIRNGIPGEVVVYDRSGNLFDFSRLGNWNVPTIQARSGKAESLDDVRNYRVDVRRELDFLPWERVKLAVKTGFLREESIKKKWGLGTGYRETYAGPALAVDDYIDSTYINQDPGFGFAPQEWISTYRLYDIYKANPDAFTKTQSDEVNNWNSIVGQNKRLTEISDAWYAQLEATAFDGRLRVIGGLRQETKTRKGATVRVDGRWNYVKNPDGTLYRNETLLGGTGLVRIDQTNSPLFATNETGDALRADLTSRGITYPAAVIANGTLAAQQLQRILLAPVDGKSKADPSYSINTSFEITKKLVAKVAWSRTFGRIPIEDATRGLLTAGNSFNISEDTDPTAIPRGRITVANPNLLPEISDNWDFALSYYTDMGGKFEISYFTKSLKNFSDTVTYTSGTPEFSALINGIGLDPADYVDWEISTAMNGIGTGKVDGYELYAQHDLRVFGEWGRRISAFATYSHSEREENNTTRISARPAATDLYTWGLNVSTKRISFLVRGNWRDDTFKQGNGNFTYDGTVYQLATFDPARMWVDVNFNWQFAEKYSFFVSGRDVLRGDTKVIRKSGGNIYPEYSRPDDYREFGVQVTFGIRGSF